MLCAINSSFFDIVESEKMLKDTSLSKIIWKRLGNNFCCSFEMQLDHVVKERSIDMIFV